MVGFIECESLNINYNIMGIATISYNYVSNEDTLSLSNTLTIGGIQFNGYITEVYQQPISNTEDAATGPWYTTSVTMIAVTK